ncbi:FAD/NAD(P)-binding domain-containing protein [Colletotrichum scovillei]|uniref:FAD/NAD(P)-binding domain-containing protein n=1 Tax=Colletotrichum scovillei TaxID=1209932 RepID=A0A9P7UDN6_9PEZI|nr:FAD/NAD(P)-binding domain-containing protein [Colletotrichum scovillei]KAG7065202.1 FAD/NAD(P)-binding domain-containing protein [Colletotrichum scovillei]KAG7067804.1 FAD/NAD(P)-binding domain-containing protein [Colletotrichum scovillei]
MIQNDGVPHLTTNGNSLGDMQKEVDYSWAAPLLERTIDADRKVRVICVGAGFSGIGASIHMREHIRDVDFQIYEAADDVGGVWHHNRYAGAACDIPAHSYQYSFCQNTQWSEFYAPGPEIHRYLKRVVDHYKLQSLIKLRHRVVGAQWSQEHAKWSVRVLDLDKNEEKVDEADYFLYATGLLSKPKWPTIADRERYRGILHHSANWDAAKEEAQEGFSWKDKRVAVIGVGSSAIQIMPQMQRKAKHVTNFVRSRTWISSTFASAFLERLNEGAGASNHAFSPEEKKSFTNEELYSQFRRELERGLNAVHKITEQGQPLQLEARRIIEEKMLEKLASKPEIAKRLIPDFPVACKRLTPGPGYLESLTADNVEFCSQELASFTEKGLVTADGRELEFDAIICATGFDVSAVPSFPIHGANNVNLQDMWVKDVKQYLAVCVPQMPNFFPILSAQSGVGSGSLLILMEQQIAYVTKCIQKCIREGYKSIVVKDDAVESFLRYADNYFDRTVYSGNCKSWYKNGASGKAKIRTLWPGSCLHGYTALRHPRWEDFEYERAEDYDHRMAWLGNGDVRPDLDRVFYLDEIWAMHKDHPMFND